MATLIIFEQFFEPIRFFVPGTDQGDHVNAAIAAAGDAPSTEALDQFTKLVDGGHLTEISHDGCGVIDHGDEPFDRIVHVTCG